MKPLLLMVVGCHRSGTSAVAGALHHLGWYTGPELMPPSLDNPKGYYESMPLVRLHESALQRAGMTWDTATVLDTEWAKSFGARQAFVRARQLLAQCTDDMPDSRLVLKDPRTCMFRLMWQAACAAEGFELKALRIQREEHAIIQSLCRRDKFKVEHAKRVVANHRAGMTDWAEHVPSAIICYEALVQNWRRELGDALVRIGSSVRTVVGEQAVDDYLDRGLNHA